MYWGEPARAARIWAYKSCCCHDSRRMGSLGGRLAFMGKAVCGKLSVDFSGLGAGSTASSLPPMGRFSVDFSGLGAGSTASSLPPMGKFRVDFSGLGAEFT